MRESEFRMNLYSSPDYYLYSDDPESAPLTSNVRRHRTTLWCPTVLQTATEKKKAREGQKLSSVGTFVYGNWLWLFPLSLTQQKWCSTAAQLHTSKSVMPLQWPVKRCGSVHEFRLTPSATVGESEFSSVQDPNTEKVQKNAIYYDETQHANFRGKPIFQATK